MIPHVTTGRPLKQNTERTGDAEQYEFFVREYFGFCHAEIDSVHDRALSVFFLELSRTVRSVIVRGRFEIDFR